MREKLKSQGMKVKAKIHDGEIAAIGKKFTQNQVKKRKCANIKISVYQPLWGMTLQEKEAQKDYST